MGRDDRIPAGLMDSVALFARPAVAPATRLCNGGCRQFGGGVHQSAASDASLVRHHISMILNQLHDSGAIARSVVRGLQIPEAKHIPRFLR